jgi:hypothetical protein
MRRTVRAHPRLLSSGRYRRLLLPAVGALVASAVTFTAGPGVAAADRGPGSGAPPPGPPILHAPPPRAPQLENAPGSPWHASPILVSGAGAYRSGEFLYQDYLFDDQGAGATYTYPNDPRYANDAADLVEFRVKPWGGGLVVRLTYNAMIDPSLTASTIALGDSAAPLPLPFGAGAREPAQVFVTVHGSTAVATDAATGATLPGRAPKAGVDLTRRQVTVWIPRQTFDTRGAPAGRIASASGLWDTAANQYLQPVPGAATATRPGNGGTAGGALFNVAFRFAESGMWRDSAQSAALTSGDLSPFFATVDLRKLRAHINDDMDNQPGGVPTKGLTSRIYASHFEDAQGRKVGPVSYCLEPCARVADFTSQLQPYSLYLPDTPAPRGGYGMTLNLHYCGGNYTNGPPDAAELANRGTGSVVLTPEGRGLCFWYWSESGADVFEAWADAARHFPLDPGFTSISGWSMGGYGTYKLVAQFPDLFARALPDIGCVSAETGWPGEPAAPISGQGAEILPLVGSFRDVPILSANANADQLCLTSSQQQVLGQFAAHGYQFDWRFYVGGHGPFYPTNAQAAAFLGTARVDSNPPHVTYVLDGLMNEPRFGLTSDHAYWLFGLSLRDPSAANQHGTVDVFSHGFGVTDAQPAPIQATSGTSGSQTYSGELETLNPPQRVAPADVLDITLTNISAVTIDTARARVDCHAKLDITSDGPATVHLSGCARTVSVAGAGSEVSQ